MANPMKLALINAGLHDHIDEIIVAGQEKRDRAPGVHLSSAIQPDKDKSGKPVYCPRQLCLEHDYAPYEAQTDPFMVQTFRMGEKIHDMWQEWFLNAHAAAQDEIEQRGKHLGYDMNFTMDVLGRVPPKPGGQLFVIDVKGYNEARCIECLLADRPPVDARIQINMYLHLIRELYGMNDVLGMVLLHNKNGRKLTPENIYPTQLPRQEMYYKWYWTWAFAYSPEMAAPYIDRLNQHLKDYARVKSEGMYPKRLSVCESPQTRRASQCGMCRVCFSNAFDREQYLIKPK